MANFFTSFVCVVKERCLICYRSVFSLERGQQAPRAGCFISTSCPAWSEKIGNFCRGKRHHCRHPQAYYQLSGMCYKKEPPLPQLEMTISLCTRTVNRFHGRTPWQRVSKIIRTRRQGQRSSFRGFYREIEDIRLQCAGSGEVTGKNSKCHSSGLHLDSRHTKLEHHPPEEYLRQKKRTQLIAVQESRAS